MDASMWVAKTGLDAQQTRMNVISNNLANVNAMEVMVKLMDQSRSFEMQVNVIKQSKDVDEAGGSMMRATG